MITGVTKKAAIELLRTYSAYSYDIIAFAWLAKPKIPDFQYQERLDGILSGWSHSKYIADIMRLRFLTYILKNILSHFVESEERI